MRSRYLPFILSLLMSCQAPTSPVKITPGSERIPQIEIQIVGRAQKGFFLGMQPYLTKDDYRSEDTFYQALKAYFDYAKREEVIASERTVIVFPENIGYWLVASGETDSVFSQVTFSNATKEMKFEHLGRFILVYLFEKNYSQDRTKESVFRMKAWQMAEVYQNVFSRLAQEFRVDIVAGSIVLPEPKVVEGKITMTDGPLQNVSFYFHSNGTIDPEITRKKTPGDQELGLVFGAKDTNPSIMKTPLGLLLPSLDVEQTEEIKTTIDKEVQFLAKPAFAYQPAAVGKLKKTNFPNVIRVYLNGNFWETKTYGTADILYKDKQVNVKRIKENGFGMIYALGI